MEEILHSQTNLLHLPGNLSPVLTPRDIKLGKAGPQLMSCSGCEKTPQRGVNTNRLEFLLQGHADRLKEKVTYFRREGVGLS